MHLSPPEHGVHQWIMRSAWDLRKAGRPESDVVQVIRNLEPELRDRRRFQPGEVEDAVAKAFGATSAPRYRRPKSPDFDPGLLRQLMEESPTPNPKEFAATSPDAPGDYSPADFLRMAFDAGSLVCLGRKSKHGYSCETMPLDMHVDDMPPGMTHVVPNSMAGAVGRKDDGKLSPRCRDNQPEQRVFLVVEADRFGTDYQSQVAIIMAIRAAFPEARLAAVVFSGSRSLHSWWRVDSLPDDHKAAIFRQAVRLGADPVTWSLIQLVRLPGATRDNGAVQKLGWVDVEALHG